MRRGRRRHLHPALRRPHPGLPDSPPRSDLSRGYGSCATGLSDAAYTSHARIDAPSSGRRRRQSMLQRLKRHPFDVVAHFEDVLVLTYALPAADLQPLLPRGLELDVFDDGAERVGFVAIAMVSVRGMRPAFFPRWLGQRFILVGTRVFVRHRDAAGRTRRGLRILESR